VRIAHISDCYLPRTGGIETQVRGLSQAQRGAGRQVTVVTATPAQPGRPVIPGEVDQGVPVHRLAVGAMKGLPVTPHVGGRLRAVLTEHADVVHVHGGLVSPFAWPALATAVRSGMPAVVSVHSMWDGWSGAIRAAGRAAGWSRWPVIWSTVSHAAARSLSAALGPGADVRVLHNGIDIPQWRPTPTVERASSVFTVVAVTRLALRKRAGALLDILQESRAQIPGDIPIRAVLIGDGPDRGRVERTIASRGMDWVTCLGWRSHDEIRTVFADSDVFVNATRLESFGIAALEARTFGLPVVALASSGVGEFITHGREGLLGADDSALARSIAMLAMDRDLLEAMTQHNRAHDPPFGWPTVVASADQNYRDAVARIR